MKAISIRQPWAQLIAEGRKTIELRSWRTQHRGPLLVVSSLSRVNDEAMLRLNIDPDNALRGYALAIVDVVDVRPAVTIDAPRACCEPIAGEFAWLLENARPVRPFKVRGSLSFYKVDDALVHILDDSHLTLRQRQAL